MAYPKNNLRPWYPNKAGTRWTRDEAKPVEKREEIACSEMMRPFLVGEANGDSMLAVLLTVRNMLRVPEAWTNAARALGKSGTPTEATSQSAVRWSITGALEHATFPYYTREQRRTVLETIKEYLPTDSRASLSIWEADKDRRHTQVVRLLNTAIADRKRLLGAKPADVA
jgi:hypothetical protein